MKAFEAKHYLLSAEILWDRVEDKSIYPYSLPAVAHTNNITFHPEVTFFVGENGSGKSTLIEALAVAWGFNPEGGTKNFNFNTHASHSSLAKNLRLTKSAARARDGFFLRAESYFNVATQIEKLDSEPSLGAPIIASYGGKSLHEQSHGESFFALLEHRFGGNGLYVLDEPEAALSPSRQMSMLTRMHDLVKQKSQFIIATHSPILMAYPGALIYHVTKYGLEQIAYEDTEHFQVTRNFLNRHEEMVKMCWRSDVNYEIVEPKLSDIPALATMHTRAWQEAYRGIFPDDFLDSLPVEKRIEVWNKSLTDAEVFKRAARSGDAWLGFVFGGPVREVIKSEGGEGEIYGLYVAKSAYRQGIGRALFKLAHDDLKARGFKMFLLGVLKDNHRARSFYEAMGGKPRDTPLIYTLEGVKYAEVVYEFAVG